jgi:hypothetical protein
MVGMNGDMVIRVTANRRVAAQKKRQGFAPQYKSQKYYARQWA